ncbi:hypothetical protein HYDPIDRAFT_116629 [Hydnomerulius pinastri MD-312]|uniref:Uncharacterized protein n=1 Tax=Hydnomerulius pinastri MD-312 TaxID=994086 RepID=A0A0C9V5S2_9AGAM|nr:hypothetical protein HYDPIDRAFT_116629 [Hydnomerulius pinastri MD-312]
MYTPSSSSSSSPRPILKQHQASSSYVHAMSKSPDRLHAVHFPPSPTLTRTYVVHSSLAYDRSPIIVAPNTCALPERGCPGRTYTLDEDRFKSSSPPKRRSHNNGIHLHPRAVSNHPMSNSPPRTSGVEEDPLRTPTRTFSLLPPPLIPDLSSESDESDGFTSPPLSMINSSLTPAPSIPRPRARGDTMIYSGAACLEQGYPHNSPNPSFLPYAPSLEDAHKARRRRQRDRSRERERYRESKYELSYTSDEASSDGGYKSFSLCVGFGGSDDSCLGGF